MENKTIVAVKAIIRNEDKFLILKRSDSDLIKPNTWEFSGGKLDFGEKLEQALLREAKEETGLTITIGELAYATSFLTSPVRQVALVAYHCSAQSREVRLSFEHSAFQWVCKEQLMQTIEQGIAANLEKYSVLEQLHFDL